MDPIPDPLLPSSDPRLRILGLKSVGRGWNQLQLTERSDHHYRMSSLLGPWCVHTAYINNKAKPSHHSNANINPTENRKAAPKKL